MPRIAPAPVVLLLAAVASLGCVQRTISITSDPSGALVHLNDEQVGRTPVTVPFIFYGVYDVRLEADGYEPLWTAQKAKAPWWEMPPIDLFAEAVPNAKAQLHWHFALDPATPAGEVDPHELVDHAKQLQATISPDAPAPAPSPER
jgi:hypothetical protein